MEPEMKSGSSVPAKLDTAVYSRGHKRKKFLNRGDDCSSTASSANTQDPLRMKLEKTTETSAIYNSLHGLDRSGFGSVTEDIEVLHALKKSHLLRLSSSLNSPAPSMHLDVEKERLVDQNITSVPQFNVIDLEDDNSVPQCNVIDLEDDNPQGHVIAADIPAIILDSDEEDNGYQRHSDLHDNGALNEPSHNPLANDLTVKDHQEIKSPKDDDRNSAANYCVQVDKSGDADIKKDIQVDGSDDVKTSRGFIGSSLAECSIQVDESPYTGLESELQVRDTEKVKDSWDVVGDLSAKCNFLVDLSSYCVENNRVMKEENHQSSDEDDAFVKNKTENDIQIRDSGKVKAPRDVGDLPAKSTIQVEERAYTGVKNHTVVKDDINQIHVGDDGLDKIDAEDSTKVKASRGAVEDSPDRRKVQVDAGMESCMVVREGTPEIGVKGDVLSEIHTKDDIEDTTRKNVKSLRDTIVDSPAKSNIQVDESTYTDMETDIAIEEDSNPTDVEDDGLDDIWKEMTFALEYSKDSAADRVAYECIQDDAGCDHNFVLKDDIGYVCRICGVIQRSIDTIIEFQCAKKRSTRTYVYEPKNSNIKESIDAIPVGIRSPDILVTEIAAHPRHRKEMKPHQVEGFNFLCSNLVADNPGGCILAHAPGSGKTFLIISFIQSFLAKYPNARPLVVLPKGILATWKKEFQIWQVENIPLHDFYTSKAENRSQQLDVLRRWVKEKSILFLGYKQLSVIVCDNRSSKIAAECQDILLKVPTILILDEGHTPRNEETDVLQSLSQVQTMRKVVLSGTLYQNHVKEVFNILNLVRPQFLKLKASRLIVNRIMGRVQISRVRKHLKHGADSAFFDLIEYTLQKDEDFRRKKAVIQDLREMTSKVLHYYKGDFLDELPGLVDFIVVLNLSARQKDEVRKLRKLDKFKRISLGSAVYMHPQLKIFSQMCFATGEKGSNIDDKKIDTMLENLDLREGVKMKFFLNMLQLCESASEKLLVFSQYILPLKLLERLSAKVKGWSLGNELFMITGDSNTEQRELCMEQFNGSSNAKVFFGSIKACGEGISLVGASRILILDVHLNPSVTRQAIGRAFRPGQKKKVYAYRLIAADSPEEEDHLNCSRKELISKMWFEWNENCRDQDFEMKAIDVNECGDMFFESPWLREDLNVLYKR